MITNVDIIKVVGRNIIKVVEGNIIKVVERNKTNEKVEIVEL